MTSMVESERESGTYERLLCAAGPVFATHGYAGATVREICGVAKVNIASVGYHFGDKMGLYREVINQIRSAKTRRFPIPDIQTYSDPAERLLAFVHMLLSRMLEEGQDGWQIRLLLQEMEHPTEALDTIVHDHFSPVFERLCATLAELVPEPIQPQTLQHLGLSVIGQCLHYRVSRRAICRLVMSDDSEENLDINALAIHITSVSLAAARADFTKQKEHLGQLLLARQSRQ